MEKMHCDTSRSTLGFSHQNDASMETSQCSALFSKECLSRLPKRRRGLFLAGSSSAGDLLHASSSEIPTENLFGGTDSFEVGNKFDRRQIKSARGISVLQNITAQADTLAETQSCLYCKAKRFQLEPKGFCCSDGGVLLASNDVPAPLWQLFTESSELAKQFRTYVRTYNNTFGFTSFGVTYDKDLCRRNFGVYTFRAQGQIYHFLNELLSFDDNPSHLQLYFYDTEQQIQQRTESCDRLHPHIIRIIVEILVHNPYSKFFQSLSNIPDIRDRCIAIKDNPQLDQRVYNAPLASQVAAIWVEQPGQHLSASRHIIVHSKPGFIHRVQYFYACYDPLQYPLLFPHGDFGWHEGIERNTTRGLQRESPHQTFDLNHLHSADQLLGQEATLLKEGRKKNQNCVSCREYYAYKLQIRPNSKSILLHSGRLFQQYVVDMYIKLESSRLDYIRLNQDQLRAEVYQNIIDCVSVGERNGAQVGKKIVLPASFIGGPRDMRRRYMDAMALVQRYGKPDLFVTMTCNPSWTEIQKELLPVEEAQNRPDLATRVFRAKLELLKQELFKKEIFGPVEAYVYVIEFQKRGLPHAHFLLILKHGSKIQSPDLFDRYVCAEIPNKAKFPHLYQAVWKHMLHGPCGILNPENICMKKTGKCKNHYPKEFCDQTTQSTDSYPIYKRRNNIEPIKVRNHLLDNRWVIPYSPYLLAKFDCHMNVEICSTIKAVKYLYKYIYKGHDRIGFHLSIENEADTVDEIKSFQSARWVSPPEAVWRIYRFPLNDIHPSVINLPLHMENSQNVTFNRNADLENVIAFTPSLKTMLTEYFTANLIYPEARKYLYREFPEHFVWDKKGKAWHPRKKGFSIGRIVTASPQEGERYYLRLLLNHVRGATSFENLKMVGNVCAASFREAALLLGLLEADNSVQLCLQEALVYHMPQSLRRLFAIILVYCNPVNAYALWEEFSTHLSEDYVRLPAVNRRTATMRALKDIGFLLESMGRTINDYHLVSYKIDIDEVERGNKEIQDELNLPVSEDDLAAIEKLNLQQKEAYDTILKTSLSNNGHAFFIDGPGGTGKTYLYCALLATLRSKGYIALATASSGVAASILPGGRTAHSRFKIPINVDENTTCNMSKQSGLARLLCAAKLIIWDEAPMMKRQGIEAFDRMLQDICNCKLPFGGKTVVFGGDFRQVLPVMPRATVEQTVDASLVKSPLWSALTKFRFTENIRARLDPTFARFLLRLGDGTEPCILEDNIRLPSSMVLPYVDESSINSLIQVTFPNIENYANCTDSMINRAILTPTNELVDQINDTLIESFYGNPTNYKSFDRAIDETQHVLQEDFFNTMTPSGFPPHVLQLKVNCPIILLRNIDPSRGLCNGTRLIGKTFGPNLIGAEIAVGGHKGKHVFIPRIPLHPAENESTTFAFCRTQFPIRLCFAMTINKAQGQTLDFVGVYLPQPVFSHGQLYVALSRAKTATSVRILVTSGLNTEPNNTITRNVVYRDVFSHAAKD